MREGYAVTVSKNGETILTIERRMLSGKSEFSSEEADAIREAAEHLLAFIGPPTVMCFACGSIEGHGLECPLAEQK